MSIVKSNKSEVFPATVPWGHLNQRGVYYLIEHFEDKYAFYKHDISFGFKHGIRIDKVYYDNPDKTLIRVRDLSGNSWGKGSWIIIRTDYFLTLEDAIGHLEGETRVYPPKRKPELIRPMTENQLKEYWNVTGD